MYSRLSRTQTIQSNESSTSKELLFLIATNDLENIKKQKLINSSNINKVIELVTKSTALHYSLNHSDGQIAKYLLENGADPYIKNASGLDAFELSLNLHKKHVYEYLLDKYKNKITDLTEQTVQLNKKLKLSTESKDYLLK